MVLLNFQSMLTSVYAPNELSLLLNKHVTYLPIRTDDTMDVSQSLLLNILRVITNLAMDKTSHSQLKVSFLGKLARF